MADAQKKCARVKTTPWLVGLGVLTAVAFGYLLLGGGFKEAQRMRAREVRARRVGPAAPPVEKKRIYSYARTIKAVKPSVVGISFPGARPFLEAWPSHDFDFIIGGANRNNQKQPGNPKAQKQRWRPNDDLLAAAPVQNQREEYLECPNCRIRITPSPGIPWSGAKCPSCGTTMAHIIKIGGASKTQTTLSQPAANPFRIPYRPEHQPRTPGRFGLIPRGWSQALGTPGGQGTPGPQITRGNAGAMGAGIIVSKRGYVLTNAHLLQANRNPKITIFTKQGMQSYPATVESVMAELDLAVIKIQAPGRTDFPVAPLGDSARSQVGETVLAIGNPFGLSQTVTSGIISAKRQSVTVEGLRLDGMIQTDAPINDGNSGGPLINLRGEVIGINTAIYSPMETHTGLGFAIPISRAKRVFAKYLDPPEAAAAPNGTPAGMKWISGKPPRAYPTAAQNDTPEEAPAWMGLEFQILNDTLAERFKTPFDRGLLINHVFPSSPAADAGLKPGDVIYRANGRRINDETRIRTFLVDKKPGDVVRFSIFRQGRKLKVEVTMAGGQYRKAAAQQALPKGGLLEGAEIEAGTADIVSLGLTVDKITPEIAFAFGLPEGSRGVVIAGVEGLALSKGVKEGDVISSIDGRPTPNRLLLFKAMKKHNVRKGVDLGLIRDEREVHVFLKEPRVRRAAGI